MVMSEFPTSMGQDHFLGETIRRDDCEQLRNRRRLERGSERKTVVGEALL